MISGLSCREFEDDTEHENLPVFIIELIEHTGEQVSLCELVVASGVHEVVRKRRLSLT